MSRKYFGTDGVRGPYGGDIMNESFAWRLGAAAARFALTRGAKAGGTVIIGRDTRASGESLERALADGLASAGLLPVSAGVVPTPARGARALCAAESSPAATPAPFPAALATGGMPPCPLLPNTASAPLAKTGASFAVASSIPAIPCCAAAVNGAASCASAAKLLRAASVRTSA